MRISHRHKFIFFANPKTGSESLRDFLDPLSDIRGVAYPATTPAFPFYSHMRPIELLAVFRERGWKYDDYYRFVCVRNPWTRMVSLYNMIKKIDPAFGDTFSEWLKKASASGHGGGGADFMRWRKYGTYALRNFIGGDMSLVQDVFRMEDMAEIPQALAKRGLPVSVDQGIKHLNVGKMQSLYQSFYTPELKKLVAERYAEEIEMFKYSFDQG